MLDYVPRDRRRQLTLIAIGVVALLALAGIAWALTGGIYATGDITLNATDGPEVTVTLDSERQLLLDGPSGGSDTIELVTEDGSVTFTSNGQTTVTINSGDITGTTTSVTGLSVDGTALTINPEDKPAATIEGSLNEFSYRDGVVDDGTVDFSYTGSSGTATITVPMDHDGTVAALDASTGQYLGFADCSGGACTFENLDASQSRDVQLVTSAGEPTVTDLSPEGDQDSPPSDFAVNVTDPDFDRGGGLDVTFNLDGSEIGTETVTENGTVTTTIPSSGQTGGSHTWSVEATDEFGESAIASASYRIPDQLEIRNETNPSEVIESPPDMTVRFFGDEQVFERSGNPINMTDLPVDEDFIVQVEASDGYNARTVYIQSIYDQQTVYLLNETVDSITPRFVLDDPTGQYDSETVVFIQRPINVSGSTEFQTIHADQFGVEGVTATLQTEQRYQIKIMNPNGEQQTIGPYRGDVSENVQIRPGSPTIQLPQLEDGWGADASITENVIEYRYEDPDDLTTSLVVNVHEKGNETNSLESRSYTNLGSASGVHLLSENQSELTWVVTFDVTRDGEEFSVTREVANRVNLVPSFGDDWRLFVGLGMLFMSAGVFSRLNRGVGGVVTALTGGLLYWTGFLSGITAAASVVIAIFVAVIYHAYTSRGP